MCHPVRSRYFWPRQAASTVTAYMMPKNRINTAFLLHVVRELFKGTEILSVFRIRSRICIGDNDFRNSRNSRCLFLKMFTNYKADSTMMRINKCQFAKERKTQSMWNEYIEMENIADFDQHTSSSLRSSRTRTASERFYM